MSVDVRLRHARKCNRAEGGVMVGRWWRDGGRGSQNVQCLVHGLGLCGRDPDVRHDRAADRGAAVPVSFSVSVRVSVSVSVTIEVLRFL